MEGVTLSMVAQDSPAHLPSACLPLPSPQADPDQECLTRAAPLPARAASHPRGSIPDGAPVGQPGQGLSRPSLWLLRGSQS